MNNFDILISGGTVVSHRGIGQADIGISEGQIVAIGTLDRARADKIFNASGLHILPGLIDTQVHFREPGLEVAEDIESGTRGAVLGGITGVFEMPNTLPPTDSPESLEHKLRIAEQTAWCNYAFYLGGTEQNAEELGKFEKSPGCCGVKVFMGASTGNLLVPDDDTLALILRNGFRRVAVHCEDNDRINDRKMIRKNDVANHPIWRDETTSLRATERLISLARKYHRRVHVLHVTTAEEIEFLKYQKDIASVEVTPQHLTFFAPDCYKELGTLAQMNPPIRELRHHRALWSALIDGVVDIIGSDHAPHTLEAKALTYPESPSGMTGVQTTVPVMLDHVAAGRLTLSTLIDLMCEGPLRVFGLINKGRLVVGYDADLTIVDLAARKRIDDSWIASKSGWTPYRGKEVTGWPIVTIVGGRVVMEEGELVSTGSGRPYQFQEVDYH